MKIKLSIYNTVLMSFMVFLVLFFMINVSGSVIAVSSTAILKEVVHDNIEEIEFKNGRIDFDDVDFYEDQVSTLIYSETGELLAGSFKNEILEPLIDNEITRVLDGEIEYLIYDKLVDNKKTGDTLYVRGIISTTGMTQTLNKVFFIAMCTLPLFIIISGIGSYFICKRSLKPLNKMINTAENIIKKDDLSIRINHNKGNDEITRLSKTFDNMLDKLEKMFDKEKRFTSDVSHELRTPTAVILAQCEVLDSSESNDLIKKQALKIKSIISKLLNLIRLENGIEKAEISEIDLSELIVMVCDEQKEITDIKITTEIEENIVHKLDYSMVVRILTNLIDNSVKYIGSGNEIIVKLFKENNQTKLEVSDNGIGINRENHEKVFDRFFRVDKSRTDVDSTGLGLSIVKQLTELNNGVIDIQSEENKGTKFIITFKE